jgi:hypothetical protein
LTGYNAFGGNVNAIPTGCINPANMIGVAVTDMCINVFKIRMADVISKPIELYFKQYESYIHTMTSSSGEEFNIRFSPQRKLSHIAIAFTNTSTGLKNSPCDFSSQFTVNGTSESMNITTSPIINLKMVRVTIGGRQFPQNDYNLVFDPVNSAQGTGSYDLFRAYADYLAYSQSYRDRNGSLLNMSEWCVSPIFVYNVTGLPNDISNEAIVNIQFYSTLSNAKVLITGFYDTTCVLDYNEFGRCTSCSVK